MDDRELYMTEPTPVLAIERTLRQRLLTSYRRSFKVPPSRVLVGFSGGNDSLALALVLHGLSPLIEPEIQLVHIDHRMRPESSSDAEAAQHLAESIGLPITVLRAANSPQFLFPGTGPEEAARRVRFQLFAENWQSGDVLALAHHAGDQAETVLLHLLRGTGIEGLAGMTETSCLTIPWWDRELDQQAISVWRPFLGETKADLAQLVASRGLAHIEDPSNDDLSFRRNEIRHRLIPHLKELEPTIEERLGTLARIAADEDDLVASQAADVLRSFGVTELLPREAIDHTHLAISRRVIRAWLSDQFGLEPSFDRIEAVRKLSDRNNGGAMVQLGENVVAWVDRTHVHVRRHAIGTEGET